MRNTFKKLMGVSSLLDYIQDVDLSYDTASHSSNISELLEEKGFSKTEINKLVTLFQFEKEPLYRMFTSSEKRLIQPDIRDYIQKMHLLGVPEPLLMDEIIGELVRYSSRVHALDDAKIIIASFIMGNGSRSMDTMSHFYDHSH